MENIKEFTNDKLYKNKLLSIILSKDRQNILEITYNNACCYNTSNILPGFTTERYTKNNLNLDNIYKAFKILCQFDQQKCYDLYQILNNTKYKDIILNAISDLDKELQEYDSNYKDIIYTQHLFVGNIERDYYNFYSKINTWHASLLLDDDHNISKALYRKVDIPKLPTLLKGEKEYIKDENLTNDIISHISYLICEGNLNEYQNLLTNLDSKSKDYKAVLNGGKLYTSKIKSLQRSLTRK